MWIQHLFSLFGTIAASFVNDIGTTWLGLVLSLVFGLATTVFRVFREHGAEALRKHLRENARVAVRYTFLCAAVLYGSIAIWEAGKAVYLDHEVLVARSQSQRRTIAQNDAKRSEATPA